MSDDIHIKHKSQTWFDHLPLEILFDIFDYLSSNDIIYSFFYLNQRLQHLSGTQKHYINHLQLPIINMHFWQQVLPVIGSHIQSLTITNDCLALSFDLFPNLKILIINSSYGLIDGQLQSIVGHHHFRQLHTFKVKDEIVSKRSHSGIELDDEQLLFRKVFSDENNLQVFEYSPELISLNWREPGRLTSNVTIRSLILHLYDFRDMFTLIKHTPNLLYLNIHSSLPDLMQTSRHHCEEFLPIKLEKLYLRFVGENSRSSSERVLVDADFATIARTIKLFSLSLITLSLSCICSNVRNDNSDFLFNGTRLENQLLKSLVKLKNFYLYAERYSNATDVNKLLRTFQSQFWYDHKWSVGLHQDYNKTYVYSLPFQFNKLRGMTTFNKALSYNEEISNAKRRRLWSNVTSLELSVIDVVNSKDIFRSIKANMPKLSSITFSGIRRFSNAIHVETNVCEREDNVTLDSVTTVCFECIYIEHFKKCLIHILPNVKHLILIASELPSADSDLAPTFNKRIQQLQVGQYFNIKKLVEMDYRYLSNLQQLSLTFSHTFDVQEFEERTMLIARIFKNFPNLKLLSLDMVRCDTGVVYNIDHVFDSLSKHMHMHQITDQYEIKRAGLYLRFVKKKKYFNSNSCLNTKSISH